MPDKSEMADRAGMAEMVGMAEMADKERMTAHSHIRNAHNRNDYDKIPSPVQPVSFKKDRPQLQYPKGSLTNIFGSI